MEVIKPKIAKIKLPNCASAHMMTAKKREKKVKMVGAINLPNVSEEDFVRHFSFDGFKNMCLPS
jgi:hypothetical protein